MRPKLEHIDGLRVKRSFHYANMHLPYFENYWHYHPEMEITYIVIGKGTRYVGDNISSFSEGDLVLLGENLPHNWVSNLGAGEHVGARDLVLQFSRPFADRMLGAIPELSPLQDLLEGAARGLQFPDALGRSIIPLMQDLAQASGARRVVLMMSVLEQLASCRERKPLAGPGYDLDAQRHMSSTINQVLSCIRQNLGGKRITQEAIERWKVERAYDKPLYFNPQREGTEKITDTIFWDRSVSLFALKFGRADSESAGDIGGEVATRMAVSLQMALPLFILQVIASTAFALLLVMLRGTKLDVWGVVACVVMLSISSLFYIIVGQFLFSRVLKLAPISGYAPGLDAVKFLVLPILLSLVARLGGEARLYRAMFLEEVGKDYVRTARAKGLSEAVVLYRHVLRNALIPIITSAGSYLPYVFLGSLVFESFFGLPGLGAYVIEAIGKQDFAIVRTMVFLGSLLYIATYVVIDIAYTWADPRVRLS